MKNNWRSQSGGASITVVLFAVFLFTIMTAGFTILMLRDQDRATDADLSQSAFDSAMAGVEDAKRIISSYQHCRLSDDVNQTNLEIPQTGGQVETIPSINCDQVIKKVEQNRCDTALDLLGYSGSGRNEVPVGQSSGDESMLQSYTCLKINPYTENVYKKINSVGDTKVIPLQVKLEDQGKMKWVEVAWDSGKERKFETAGGRSIAGKNTNNPVAQLPKHQDWPEDWGSVVKVQAISWTQDDLKDINKALDYNTRSALMYPVSGGPGSTDSFNIYETDRHKPLPDVAHKYVGEDGGSVPDEYWEQMDWAGGDLSPNEPQLIKCSDEAIYESGGKNYHCRALIGLSNENYSPGPGVDSQGWSDDRITYLTLSAYYVPPGGLDVSVRMLDGDSLSPGKNVLLFNAVQPVVDSTGRANDIFRRVRSRVDTPSTSETIPFPSAALSSRNSLCKDYMISDSDTDFEDGFCSDRKGGVGRVDPGRNTPQ